MNQRMPILAAKGGTNILLMQLEVDAQGVESCQKLRQVLEGSSETIRRPSRCQITLPAVRIPEQVIKGGRISQPSNSSSGMGLEKQMGT